MKINEIIIDNLDKYRKNDFDGGMRAMVHVMDYVNRKFDFAYMYVNFYISDAEEDGYTFVFAQKDCNKIKKILTKFNYNEDAPGIDIISEVEVKEFKADNNRDVYGYGKNGVIPYDSSLVSMCEEAMVEVRWRLLVDAI